MTTYTQYIFSATDKNNEPLAYGKVYLYRTRTSIPVDTYGLVDFVMAKNPWPYILDVNGTAPNLFLADTSIGTFTINVTDVNDVQQIMYPVDDVVGILPIVANNR